MLKRLSLTSLSAVFVLGVGLIAPPASPETPASAPASQPGMGESKRSDQTKPLEGTIEKAAVTHNQIATDGQSLHYRATAANMPMRDENGKLKATVFFVAYEKESPSDIPATSSSPSDPAAATQPACKDPEHRAITFVFNGGPGAAAVWLHLGAAGPRRVALAEDGQPLPPPYRLEENPSTWLDATDLVFIDPVGTGFSRPAEGEKSEQFYGVKEDIAWVADFIRLYTTQYERWSSPKFLAGESYGTTRAAGLSEYLLDRYGITLNGIILISSVLEFQTLQTREGNDLPYWLYLPSYTAIAWYHKKLPADLMEDQFKTLQEVEPWAMDTYAPALARGDSLAADQRQAIVTRLARYTGLPADLIDRCNLRIAPRVFQKELLRGQRLLIGRFDARITGYDIEPMSTGPAYDPSQSPYFAAYSSTFNDYVRRTLKYQSVLPYEVLTGRVQPWKMGEPGEGYLSVADDLRSAVAKNPYMKVLFASGYYDLATPYFSTNYTINRLDIGPQARQNITHTFYQGGHMMYHQRLSLAKLKADVATLIRSAIPAN